MLLGSQTHELALKPERGPIIAKIAPIGASGAKSETRVAGRDPCGGFGEIRCCGNMPSLMCPIGDGSAHANKLIRTGALRGCNQDIKHPCNRTKGPLQILSSPRRDLVVTDRPEQLGYIVQLDRGRKLRSAELFEQNESRFGGNFTEDIVTFEESRAK